MEFIDLVKSSRSFRYYDPSCPVTREMLLRWIDVSRFAPSTRNDQPLRYYVAAGKSLCDSIRPNTKWAYALKDYDGPDLEHSPTGYVAVCTDFEIAPNPPRYDRDVGIVAQTMILAAASEGFGGIMIGSFNKPELKQLFEVPDRYDIRLLLAFGKPAEKIILEEQQEGQDITYYRDADFIHHVPKRPLKDIVLN